MDTKINTEHQMEKTGPYYKVECGSNRPGSVKFYRIKGPDDCMDYALHESDVEYHLSRLNAAYAAGQASSPPTLNIGMGESEVQAFVLDDLTDDSHVGLGPTHESALTIARAFMQRGMNAANAHTKAVTVEAIVNLAEEWDAYCVVTPADPDGIEDFRARLLKLIQE